MWKVCPICNESFETKVNKVCCSEACNKIYRNEYWQALRHPENNHYSSPDVWDDSFMYVDEECWTSKPTIIDIRDAIQLLDDFNISITELPQFDTFAELDRWKSDLILTSLS